MSTSVIANKKSVIAKLRVELEGILHQVKLEHKN